MIKYHDVSLSEYSIETFKTNVSNLLEYKPIRYMAAVFLYSFSIAISFLFAGIFVAPLTFKEIQDDINEDKLAEKRAEEQNFEYKYLDEYEKLEEKDVNSDLKTTTLEIPFLKTTIIMFYEDETFKYYSNTDVIYKYLNVACRKFVVENNAKKLYNDGTSEEVKTDAVKSESDLFIIKPETSVLEKKCNRFIRVGSIHDYNEKNNIKLVKEIDILEFLKNCK
uniref:Uncharacterized protein n=1 Tax=viral metagenome TaxID=1070528 RepID=A0A6C0D3V4_9ZZZZ